MAELQPDRTEAQLALFIYMDGLSGILTRQRTVMELDSLSMAHLASPETEVQSALDQFYSGNDLARKDLKSIELVFINSIFHRTRNGQLETYKNRLPAYLLYHREFFDAPVSYTHIAQRLQIELMEFHAEHPDQAVLWFHLRKNILYVVFCTPVGEDSINSFEVHKTLDVYYYILFNYQTLGPVIPGLEHLVISGELVNMEGMHNFFEENIPGMLIQTYWQWKQLTGRPPLKFHPLLPEVKI